MAATDQQAGYTERLHVPLRWWVQGTMLIASFWLALVVAMPGEVAWGITALLVALMVAAFSSYGSARVSVTDGELRAGRARIEVRFLGAADALDAEATRRVAGRDADVRAYLLLRPFLKRAVRVTVTDPADPTPYWLVTTRHPEALVRALTSKAGSDGAPAPLG